MTVTEAAAVLGISPESIKSRVYTLRLAPSSGTGPKSWTFSAAEIERYRALREERAQRTAQSYRLRHRRPA